LLKLFAVLAENPEQSRDSLVEVVVDLNIRLTLFRSTDAAPPNGST
jgi:hypothetical protein